MNNSLLVQLQKLSADRSCLVAHDVKYTVEQLSERVLKVQSKLFPLKGKNIALYGFQPFELIVTLLALDGIVDRILLIPSTFDISDVKKLQDQASVDNLLGPDFNFEHIFEYESGDHARSEIETQWLLATSGTTGTPKLITHNLRTLTRTVKVNPETGKNYIWGLLFDPNRFAGLQVVLQSLLSGSVLILPEKLDFETQVSTIIKHGANSLSATPTLWRKLLIDGRIKNLNLKQITLGGEIADQPILDALKKVFPLARIVHIYASTEIGTGFAVSDGRAGFPLSWLHSSFQVPPLRIGGNNHLLIKPHIFPTSSYITDQMTDDGFFDTQDLVCIKGDRVIFLGRASGVINVGGNKISPEWLESYLRQFAGVADARVYGKQNSIIGQLVYADIIPHDGIDRKQLREEILQKSRKDLESWQIPALISFKENLGETAAGKMSRLIQ
jgi:acyl-coenzyme A synthetase/AMP-(fatty) acid ligase